MDGSANPHDILDVLGPTNAEVSCRRSAGRHRLQGGSHQRQTLEIIVRQMLRKVRIEDPGDTEFLPGSRSQDVFEEENDRVLKKTASPPREAVLLGITKAALTTDSFISQLFQRTTRRPDRSGDQTDAKDNLRE